MWILWSLGAVVFWLAHVSADAHERSRENFDLFSVVCLLAAFGDAAARRAWLSPVEAWFSEHFPSFVALYGRDENEVNTLGRFVIGSMGFGLLGLIPLFWFVLGEMSASGYIGLLMGYMYGSTSDAAKRAWVKKRQGRELISDP